MNRMVGTQQCMRSNSHPLNIIIGVTYYKLFCLRSFWCAGWCILSMLTLRNWNLISKTKSKRGKQKNKSLVEQMFGGKKSHTVWHVSETMSALFITLCLTLKGKNPGDFRFVRDAVFVFFKCKKWVFDFCQHSIGFGPKCFQMCLKPEKNV